MNLRFFSVSLIALACVALSRHSFAQAGNDNPGGVTAEYHGSITTAGYYDPYTGNAKREIDDIVVPGSIGAYALKYTRTFHTRGTNVWNHNYEWSLWVRPPGEDPGNGDGFYDGAVRGLAYPSGGRFDTIVYDSPWFIEANGPHGASDMLLDCARTAGCVPGAVYELRRSDGGKVLFEAAPTPRNFRAYKIIDPYGQATTLSYDGSGRLWEVTEPGGRYLELVYQTFTYWYPWPDATHNAAHWASEVLLTAVRANDGRGNTIETVGYGYEWVWQGDYFPEYVPYLNHAYYDDTAQATYSYADANSYDPPSTVYHGHIRRVLHTCDDPHYAGPMKFIEYEYVPWTEVHDVGRGQIKAEKNVLGQVVSRTTYPTSPTDPNLNRRTETRGDGPSRTLNYPYASSSFVWTDFKNQPYTDTSSYTSSFYGWTITDPRGNTTRYDRESVLDAVRKITYPATSDNGVTTREFTFSDPNNPYYHYGEKDENGYWTFFDRDANNRVLQTRYPDGSTEQFTYNNFGQVLTHKLRNGATETFTYDGRGLKTSSYPPATQSDPSPWNHPTYYYYYTSGANADRLQRVQDARGNTTWYEYNQRGQVTKVTYQDGTFTQSGYNLDGTLAWSTDALGHSTTYTSDEYKRILTVRNPMNETTTNWYGLDSNWQNPLLHTTNSIKWTKSPMLKNVVYEYDENFRKKYQGVALGTNDAAATNFDYDEVGNLTWVRDPRWYVTTYGYDERNRKSSMNDPIASDRNSNGNTMNWNYDAVGNKKKETRADNTFRTWDYDAMNRMTDTYGFMTEHTHYRYDLAGNVIEITDAKNAVYQFEYDELNRKRKAWYPPDATNTIRYEFWSYDENGNIHGHDTAAGKTNLFTYDNRNRRVRSFWTDGSGQDVIIHYDLAGRVGNIQTNSGETTIGIGYDDANRKIYEDQTLAGYPTRHVQNDRDADGNRANLKVYTGDRFDYSAYYDHTQRSQLSHIYWDAANTPWINYSYDASGNMTQRRDVLIGVNDSINAVYDELNRATVWEQTGAGDIPYARSDYAYDKLGRETATWRPTQQYKGESFSYNPAGQLITAAYNADNVWTGSPLNPGSTTAYTMTPDTLNRASMNINGAVSTVTSNALNQYTNIFGVTPGYDGNFNLDAFGVFTFSYDAENRVTNVSASGVTQVQCTYDGLGRVVRRSEEGVVTLYTYDEWKPIMEWDASGTMVAWNVYGAGADEILWRYERSIGYLRYHADRMGNVTSLLDLVGTIREQYTYDAFGTVTISDWGGGHARGLSWYKNRFMFTGREYLSSIACYDFRHRIYKPNIGRFLQTDPMGLQTEGEKLSAGQKALFSPGGSAPEAFSSSEMNLFRYCGDDPVDRSDPLGLKEFEIYGDMYFKAKINEQMEEIESRPMGHAYLQELRNSDFRMIIVPGAENGTSALDDPSSMNGTGSGSRFRINPLLTDSANDETGSSKRPGFIGLGHEIVGHGIENKRGEHKLRRLDNKVDHIPRSEREAIRRENELRKEHGIPKRVDFYKYDKKQH